MTTAGSSAETLALGLGVGDGVGVVLAVAVGVGLLEGVGETRGLGVGDGVGLSLVPGFVSMSTSETTARKQIT